MQRGDQFCNLVGSYSTEESMMVVGAEKLQLAYLKYSE